MRASAAHWCGGGFNTKQRSDPPDDAAEVLAWVARNTAPVSTLTEPATARRMLDLATGTVDGRNAAASTARRHRIILANAMDYAVERGLLETNPIRVLKWTAPKVSSQVDRRSVVNPHQARAPLDAVRAQQPSGPRLVAVFAVMYYAGLRPEEAINLSADNIILPPRKWDAERQLWQDPPEDGDWGELHLRTATPDAGSEWTDDGSPRERRQLKHRAEGDTRIVPTHPELTQLLRDHLAKFGTSPDGRLFGGVRGGELPTITYRHAWIKARQTALTEAEQGSPLARRPYDLRHACLSTWLNGGVYPTQVAEWAGAQRGRAVADLRQVCCGPERARQAPDQRSAAPGLISPARQPIPAHCSRRCCQAATVTASSWGAPTSSGTGSPSARRPAMWTSMASTARSRHSSIVLPRVKHPGRAGTVTK